MEGELKYSFGLASLLGWLPFGLVEDREARFLGWQEGRDEV